MKPLIKGGDMLFVEVASIAQIQQGDIILTHWEGKRLNVVHRVVRLRLTPQGIGLVTRGDANPAVDPFITTQDNLIGRVTHINWQPLP